MYLIYLSLNNFQNKLLPRELRGKDIFDIYETVSKKPVSYQASYILRHIKGLVNMKIYIRNDLTSILKDQIFLSVIVLSVDRVDQNNNRQKSLVLQNVFQIISNVNFHVHQTFNASHDI